MFEVLADVIGSIFESVDPEEALDTSGGGEPRFGASMPDGSDVAYTDAQGYGYSDRSSYLSGSDAAYDNWYDGGDDDLDNWA